MNWFIFYFLRSFRKVVNVRVDYSLITKSGNDILTVRENYIPDRKIIKDFSDFKYFEIYKEIEKELKEVFDKGALELLKEHTPIKLKNINRGYLYTGDYIVKCSWEISIDKEDIDWKEYKAWDKLWYIKSAGLQDSLHKEKNG